MIQLAFEPAFDPFHSAFRVLRQAVFHNDAIDIERLKILDVYLVEPRHCLNIRLPGPLKKSARKAASCQRDNYGRLPSASVLFDRMAPIQDAAIQTLVSRGLLDADAFCQNKILRSDILLGENLIKRIDESNKKQINLMNFLYVDLNNIPIMGPNGLKSRTGLSEYRYDIV
ncbi:ABC-three component system middle component 5 [Acetobacter persici]|uniref:Uncharacterized protein n=1 Tax=Acetobacter persici TaxID=1076596 RepID=A0A6V8IAW4_9PROT|nr:ABC-three component system middle component 5 [Acetobacter persici]GFE94730.1 hypothetical protein DmAi_27890 [Acetobacter persici]